MPFMTEFSEQPRSTRKVAPNGKLFEVYYLRAVVTGAVDNIFGFYDEPVDVSVTQRTVGGLQPNTLFWVVDTSAEGEQHMDFSHEPPRVKYISILPENSNNGSFIWTMSYKEVAMSKEELIFYGLMKGKGD